MEKLEEILKKLKEKGCSGTDALLSDCFPLDFFNEIDRFRLILGKAVG